MVSLTPQAVRHILEQPDTKEQINQQIALQVTNIKAVTAGGQERHRVVLSDGNFFVQGMLTTQLNDLVHQGLLQKNSIIQVEHYMKNQVQGRIVIILLKISILQSVVPDKIGDPQNAEQQRWFRTQSHQPTAAATPVATPMRSSNPYGGHTAHENVSSARYNSSEAPIVRSNTVNTGITPISQLNMYANKWTIQARVAAKGPIKTWVNTKGEGSLFSVELMDESCDIRGTFFREAVDKFYNFLEEGKVYNVTGGRLKIADIKWNTCKSSYEISFDQHTEIHLAPDQASIQTQALLEVKPIREIETMEPGSFIDILGVVKSKTDVANLTSKKTGKELTKCDVTLVDQSGADITLTLWDKDATRQDLREGTVVGVRRAKVSDYNGKSLSGGTLQVDLQDKQAESLRQWFQQGGASTTRSLTTSSIGGGGGGPAPLSARQTISTIKDDHLGKQEKPDYISFKATLTYLKTNKEGGAWYTACANAGEPCKNRFKVNPTTDGQWYCDKCQGTYPTCVRKWVFSGVFEDESGSTWVSFFNDQAEPLVGQTADEVYAKCHGTDGGMDDDAYNSAFFPALFKEYIVKARVKTEYHNDENRVKTSVVALNEVNYIKESNELLQAIEQF